MARRRGDVRQGRETRSLKRSKENDKETRKHGRKSLGRKSKGEEKVSSKSDAKSSSTPSAIRKSPSAQPETKADEALVQVLRRDYVPDIKDEVSELLKEALCARTPSESQKTSGPSTNSSTATADQRRTVATFRSPHYDVVEDIGNQRANLFCNQLLEDNKTYRKMLMLSLRRPRKPCTVKLLEIYHVTGEDLGPPEIDVEIGGCTIFRVPVNSGSGVNIMTEETAHSLGFHTFEPTTRVLRLADQTRRMPLEILRDIKTIIGGVAFPLIYIILQPPMKRGYDVLIGRPWLYGARVRCDWQRKRLQFRDPSNSSTVITVPWVKIPHEGETPSTSLGYTSAEDNTSSDDEGWEVRYVACC